MSWGLACTSDVIEANLQLISGVRKRTDTHSCNPHCVLWHAETAATGSNGSCVARGLLRKQAPQQRGIRQVSWCSCMWLPRRAGFANTDSRVLDKLAFTHHLLRTSAYTPNQWQAGIQTTSQASAPAVADFTITNCAPTGAMSDDVPPAFFTNLRVAVETCICLRITWSVRPSVQKTAKWFHGSSWVDSVEKVVSLSRAESAQKDAELMRNKARAPLQRLLDNIRRQIPHLNIAQVRLWLGLPAARAL